MPATSWPQVTTPILQPTTAAVPQNPLQARAPATAPLLPAVGDWSAVPDFPPQLVVPMVGVEEPEGDFCAWSCPERTSAMQNTASKVVPESEGSWLESANTGRDLFADNVMTCEGKLRCYPFPVAWGQDVRI